MALPATSQNDQERAKYLFFSGNLNWPSNYCHGDPVDRMCVLKHEIASACAAGRDTSSRNAKLALGPPRPQARPDRMGKQACFEIE